METQKPINRRRSSSIPTNQVKNFSTKFSLTTFVKRVKKLTETQRDAISKTGFGNLLVIPSYTLSKNLLVELMERWNPDKSAFMLAKGEITINLLDIALILGLRVTGIPVILKEDEPFLELEKQYGAALWNRKISVDSLEERLDSIGEKCDEDFVRTFLLYVFGTILFPNTNRKIDSKYLSFLQDLNKVSNFAWGVAVIEDLHNWLNKRKQKNVKYVGGCLILLQIWCYEHIYIARPSLLNDSLKFPRVCKWQSSKSHQRKWLTAKFKELESDQILWNLELTIEESETEIIKDLAEALRQRSIIPNNLLAIDNYKMSEQQIFKWFDKRMKIIGGEENECSLSPDIMSTGHNSHFSVQENVEVIEQIQVGSNSSIIAISDDTEDDMVLNTRVLEEENSKLRIESNDLREEITSLRDKLLLTRKVEEQNAKLRKEVELLRQQNEDLMSTYSLVYRIERLVFDESQEENAL